ncbi:hypothetical protein C9374_004310 [Naegleria lovaniensis]|uniref:Uncharacterized protein n=1 Tax=Naegleria lovaniensis TaxID=51637 RepID=A0AA88GMB5_NAELO|nr:uncharacterized protein C9374_004310 [Naegleria lovaniensis]KAG2383639.1 hypothetical protein C9374_004310 [Naegleria lovaniensis]
MVNSDHKVKWKLRSTGQVTPRAGHCVANIPGTPFMYVFGGSNNHLGDQIPSKELDVYNCTKEGSWRRAGLSSNVEAEDAKILRPKARIGAVMVGVERGQMIGELSYASTTISENQEPHNALLLFGGWHEDTVLNDLWKFNCKTEKWINLTDKQKNPPPARSNHSGVLIDNNFIIFGGLGEEIEDVKQDMYILDIQTLIWRKISLDDTDEKPPASRSHACCVHRKSMVLFGGGTEKVCFNHLYKFDLEVERWFKITPNKSEELLQAEKDPTKPISSNLVLTEPEPRMFSTAVVYDLDRMFVFGGRNGKQKINEVWQFDFANLQWNLMQVGDYLEDESNTLVLNDDDMAGSDDFDQLTLQASLPTTNNDDAMNDVSPLPSPLTPFSSKKRPTKPTPRTGMGMVVVTTGKQLGPKTQRILIFGGNDVKKKLSEVWELIVNPREFSKRVAALIESPNFSDINIKVF